MSILKTLGAGLYKIGEQAVQATAAAIDRLANKQELEAVVAAAVLVAAADGVIDPKEKTAALVAASTHPALKAFDSAEVERLFKADVELIGMDRESAILALLDRVRKITDATARSRILGVATAIANADGNLEASETEMINRMRGL